MTIAHTLIGSALSLSLVLPAAVTTSAAARAAGHPRLNDTGVLPVADDAGRQLLPPPAAGKQWAHIGSFQVPAAPTPGARTMQGQQSRFSENLKWPTLDGGTTVVYVAPSLTAEEAAQYGQFTIMEDKPSGCDSGKDQPRSKPTRLGTPTVVGGIRCEDNQQGHYLARLNGSKPDRAHVIEAWEQR